MTNAIYKYFSESGRLLEAAEFFKSLIEKDFEIVAVLAKSYLGTDEEIQAVDVLYHAATKSTVSYGVLMVQIDFLVSKVSFII